MVNLQLRNDFNVLEQGMYQVKELSAKNKQTPRVDWYY